MTNRGNFSFDFVIAHSLNFFLILPFNCNKAAASFYTCQPISIHHCKWLRMPFLVVSACVRLLIFNAALWVPSRTMCSYLLSRAYKFCYACVPYHVTTFSISHQPSPYAVKAHTHTTKGTTKLFGQWLPELWSRWAEPLVHLQPEFDVWVVGASAALSVLSNLPALLPHTLTSLSFHTPMLSHTAYSRYLPHFLLPFGLATLR